MTETGTRAAAPPRGGWAPLVGPAGAALAILLALVLGWPMLAAGGELVFSDTESYIRGGRIVWATAMDLLGGLLPSGPETAGPAGAGGGGGSAVPPGDPRAEPYVVRSFIYSLYTLFAGAQIWAPGFALLQGAMTLFMLFALIGREALSRPWILAGTFVYLAAVTPLPWFASYQMPDLLAATVILWGAVLVARFDDLGPWQRVVLTLIAAFAVAAHYGHGPVAAALYGAVLLWRAARRRLSWAVVAAAAVPVLFAPLANLSASTIVLDKPSATPLRLPILLARSIQDGPARWYLEEACPAAPLAFCDAFGDEVPRNIAAFLWDDGGIESLDSEQMQRIRDEEFLILYRAFRAYPVEQTVSLLGNAARQVVAVGTGGIWVEDETRRGRRTVAAFDRIVPWGVWAGAAALLALGLSGRMTTKEAEAAAVVALGLLLNAAVFGGLSAPVERYQSRAIWLLPALAGIAFAAWAGRTRGPRRARPRCGTAR